MISSRENRIFILLLTTEIGIQTHDMMKALGSTFKAQILLSEWKAHAFPADRPKPFLLSSLTYPVHMQFWAQFLHHYMCKLSLHFPKVFCTHQKVSLSFVESINDFLRSQRCDASFHMIFTVEPQQWKAFDPSGYTYSKLREEEPPLGLHNYQTIYSNPKDLSSTETANNIAILMTHLKQGRSLELGELLPFVDYKLGKSYYLAKMDVSVLALVLFHEKRVRDINTIEFLSSLKNNLCAKNLLRMIH